MSTGDVNYLLIVTVLAMLIGIIKGYRKGFLRLAVYIAGLILVVLIVTKISPYVSDFLIDRTTLYDEVREKIVRIYEEKNQAKDNSQIENQKATIESYGLPDVIAGALTSNNNQDMYKKLAAVLFEEYISGYLAKIVIKAGSYFILFVILAIAMFCVLAAIKIIEKIPVLKTFNRLLGVIAGGGMVVVFVWVFFIGIMMFFYDSLGTWMLNQVKSSVFLSFLFNNNYLFKMILNV